MSFLLNKKPFWFCCVYNQDFTGLGGHCPINAPNKPHRHTFWTPQCGPGMTSEGIWSVPCSHLRTALPPRPLPSPLSATLVSLPLLSTDAASALICFPPVTARSAVISAEDTRVLPLCQSSRGLQWSEDRAQAPFLFQILGLSSRHIELFRANGLSGFWLCFFGWYLLCPHPGPKSLAESEQTGPGANLSDKLWPLLVVRLGHVCMSDIHFS